MELSDEVKKKAKESTARYNHKDPWVQYEMRTCGELSYLEGYQQALKDVQERQEKHRKNMMEIGKKTMSGEIDRILAKQDMKAKGL